MHTNTHPIDRSQWWRTAGHPPPNTVPLTSTYDSRKAVSQPTMPKEASREP